MTTESALLERITTLREKAETAALNYADAKAGLARAELDLLELRFGIKPGVVVEKGGVQYRIEKIEQYWSLSEQPLAHGSQAHESRMAQQNTDAFPPLHPQKRLGGIASP